LVEFMGALTANTIYISLPKRCQDRERPDDPT